MIRAHVLPAYTPYAFQGYNIHSGSAEKCPDVDERLNESVID